MIITSPTGLYKSILPREGESGNITFTISSQDPPRTNVRAIQLPVAEEIQPAPDDIFDDETRRAQFGELVFTIAQSNRSVPGSNTKVFEVGEILAFEENPPESQIESRKSPENVELRHDTNLLDLEGVGLTEEEIEDIEQESQAKQADLEQQFVKKNTEIANIDVDIRENQKVINETNKTIKAVRVIKDIPEGDLSFDDPTYQKLLTNLDNLEVEREQLIAMRNAAVVEAEAIYQSLIQISELVR